MLESSGSGTKIDYSVHKVNQGPATKVSALATVLFVSNEDILRAKMRNLLESEGIRVFSSADVQCASEVVFCACQVNVLVIDENSLGERAVELASELSESSPGSAVIILTGPSTSTDVFEIVRLRGWRVLSEWLPLTILHGAIRQLLAGQNRPSRRGSRFRFRKSAKLVPFSPVLCVRPPAATLQERRSLKLVRRKRKGEE